MRADVAEVRRLLGRVRGVHRVEPVDGAPDEVAVFCEPQAVRPVKASLMREGYSYQPRRPGPRERHVFKLSGGSRRGPPRNSRELTRSVQRGEFDMFGGGRR